MDQNILEKAKEMFQKSADELGLTLVSVRYYNSKEDGNILEVLIDHDFSITMEEIEKYTELVNPLLDEIDDSEEAYVLDISSGGSEREIDFASLDKFIGKWLDVKLKKTGEVILMQLDQIEDGKAIFHHFIKGRKKKEILTSDEISSIRMGYKA